MDGYFFVFAGLKIFVVLMFVLNVSAILVWADRRQSAMIQDRIGPNRAVIYLPGIIFKGLALGLGFGAAALAGGYTALAAKHSEPVRLDVGFVLTEIAVLLGWMGIVLARRIARKKGSTDGIGGLFASIEDARIVFYIGLALHVLVAVLRTNVEVVDGAPVPAWAAAIFHLAGPGLTVALLAAAGLTGFLAVPPGKVGLRLAGTLHALADAAKMVFKEDFVPTNADRVLHALGPMVALFPAFVVFAVIPFGDIACIHPGDTGNFFRDLFNARVGEVFNGQYSPYVSRNGICSEGAVPLQVANLNVGMLYMFALAGTGIVGAAIAGWSSDNKFSLLGGLRASSQMVSYEVAMGLSLVGAFMTYGSVRFDDMVRWQSEHAWGIFVQPLAFFLFLTASIAENKRVPFDAPEGESEIVAGYYLEYSGMKFGMFMTGEYMELGISSAVLCTVFFGGWALPFLHRDGITLAFGDTSYFHLALTHRFVILAGVIAFFAKTMIVCWAQIFIRWTIPRFRYDQIMKLGWRFLLPCAMINMLVTGVILLVIGEGGAPLGNALDVAADVSQALVVVLGTFGFIKLVSGILAPPRKHAPAISSSSSYAQAAGGTQTTPMQA